MDEISSEGSWTIANKPEPDWEFWVNDNGSQLEVHVGRREGGSGEFVFIKDDDSMIGLSARAFIGTVAHIAAHRPEFRSELLRAMEAVQS